MTTTPRVRRLLAVLSALLLCLLAAASPGAARTVLDGRVDPSAPWAITELTWDMHDTDLRTRWSAQESPAGDWADSYDVAVVVGGTARPVETLRVPYWSGHFGDVPSGTSITWSVRASGGGVDGEWASFSTRTGGHAPGDVLDLQVESDPEADALDVSWAAPAEQVADYWVTLDDGAHGSARTFTTSSTRVRVPMTQGRTPVELRVRAGNAYGWSYGSSLSTFYEDVPAAPSEVNARPRAGGFALKWQMVRWADHTDRWEVLVDGQVVPSEARPGGVGRNMLADIEGLATGQEYEVGVRAVNEHGPGIVSSVVARTYDLPDQVAAPRVKSGLKGGGLSVRVSWTPPVDWGGGEECCYRITGHGPADRAGVPALVERWSDAPATRFDFPVGRAGKWRFQVEARTGAGFSPISEPSRRVRAR